MSVNQRHKRTRLHGLERWNTHYRAAQLIAAPAPEDEVRLTQSELRVDEDAEYVPWRVLQTRQRNGRQEAFVQWAGYPISQSTSGAGGWHSRVFQCAVPF